jgi:tricorn protease
MGGSNMSYRVASRIEQNRIPIKSAPAGPGAIIYEQFGSLHIYDLASHHELAVNVHIDADLVQVRPHFEKAAKKIENEPGRTGAEFF